MFTGNASKSVKSFHKARECGRRGIGKVNWLVKVCTSRAVCMQDVAGEESSS
jgi:hypothetical protein